MLDVGFELHPVRVWEVDRGASDVLVDPLDRYAASVEVRPERPQLVELFADPEGDVPEPDRRVVVAGSTCRRTTS
jgi:hypothetical protein